MKRIEQTHVAIEMLACSDTFESRLGQQHVAHLAQSIKELDLIHPPLVRASDLQVIAGEDRVAAHVLLNRDEVLVDLVECSDAEVEAIRAAENERRRSPPPAEVKALVQSFEDRMFSPPPPMEPDASMLSEVAADWALDMEGELSEEAETVSAQVMEAIAAIQPKRGRGRPKSTRGAAIDEAAKSLGTTPNAVRKKLARVDDSAPPFETWGREPDAKIVADAAKTYNALTNAYSKVHAAMVCITTMQKAAQLRDDIANPMWEELKRIGKRLKGQRPVALCAWCKGTTAVMPKCAACFGSGHIPESRVSGVPAELREAGVVMVEGKRVDAEWGF